MISCFFKLILRSLLFDGDGCDSITAGSSLLPAFCSRYVDECSDTELALLDELFDVGLRVWISEKGGRKCPTTNEKNQKQSSALRVNKEVYPRLSA